MSSLTRQGLLYGLAAYGLWGVIPLYFRWLNSVADSYDILAHRIVWSAVMLIVVLSLLGNQWHRLWAALTYQRTALVLVLSSILIALNWFVYIYGVETRRVMQCSLGYFMTPLVNVGLGVFLLGERFRPWQVVALAFGLVGLLIMVCLTEGFSWLAISLAITFSTYGLLRKLAPVDTLIGLTAESLLLTPFALWFLFSMGKAWQTTDAGGHWMLIFTGPATVIPLFCFGQAARMLPLSTLGFLQYLSPSLQFLVAVLLLGEELNLIKAIAFGIVWIGLIIFTLDVLRAQKQKKMAIEKTKQHKTHSLGEAELA